MTVKLYKAFQTWAELAKFWINERDHVFGQSGYMGVVFRLPIASPGHRLMETHHVH